MKFNEKLAAAAAANKSLVCVGLDPDPTLMPARISVLDFNKAIVEQTADLVCAYKPQFAFYEALGLPGLEALQKTVEFIPRNIPVIGDAKRSDVGNTAKAYARSVFDVFGCDAVTVNPYLGYDSLEPFLEYRDKGVFVLCRTSNKGALDFQSLKVTPGGRALYEVVAAKARKWNKHGNVGLVVGATYPDELKIIRQSCPEMPLLIPGIGAQGGDIELTVKYGADAGGGNAVINSSRGIIYAGLDKEFAGAARKAALELRRQINAYLQARVPS